MKTSELIGPALNWAVAKCEGTRCYTAHYEHTMTGICILDAELVDMQTDGAQELKYSTDWSQGGPIIEQEGLSVWVFDDVTWRAENPFSSIIQNVQEGPTPLISAMRCYVASKLGDEVEIPAELL